MSAFADLPRRHYRAIAIDPPTRFVAGTKGRPQHYPRLTDRAIAALPIGDLAHPDGCFLFYWITSAKLYRPPGSIAQLTPELTARQWGFRWSGRAFLWIKTCQNDRDRLHTGPGLTTRKNAEDVLLFRLGRPIRRDAGVHEIIIAPRREHSRKPDEFYARVMRFCDGPYLDVFGRQSRAGWDVVGNEAGKFDEG